MVEIIFTKMRFRAEQLRLSDFEGNHKMKRK